jgi:hypothetical protein
MRMKLSTEYIKGRIAEWYRDVLVPGEEDDCGHLYVAGGWTRVSKSRFEKLIRDGDYSISLENGLDGGGFEKVWFEGRTLDIFWGRQSIKSSNRGLFDRLIAVLSNGKNVARTFYERGTNDSDFLVISNPEDTEILAMFYHSD